MRFLLDENFPVTAKTLLEDYGHECLRAWEILGAGADDSEIFELAMAKGAALLTTDRDFLYIQPQTQGDHHGIIVITLKQPNERKIVMRLEWFLKQFDADALRNLTYKLDDQSYRVSRKSDQ